MRFLKPILIAVSAVAVTATGVAAWRHHANPAAPSLLAALSSSASAPVASDAGGQADPNTPFVLVEAANRSFEGSPALALTVSQPLARQDFDSLIQVFEMSETPAAKKPLKAGKKAEAEAGDEEGEAITDTPEEDESSREQAKAKATTVSTAPADVDVKGGKLVKGGWVLGPNPRIVFFPNVKPQTRYVVVIKPGLKDGIDRTLKDEARYSIRTAAISPAYYFASNGMVLPAGQNGGLPVITVNVPEVDVQFLRVRKEQLPRFLEMVIAGPRKAAKPVNEDGEDGEEAEWNQPYSKRHHELHGAVSSWELDPLHKMTDSVYQARFVTEQQPNKQSVTFIPVEDIESLKQPGIYVAVMSKPGRFGYDYQTTYFYVSDLGVSLHNYPKGATVLVSSLVNGKGLDGVDVSWLGANGKVLAHAASNGEGRVDFAERPDKARVLLAEKGQQVSMLALREPSLDLSEFETGGDLYKPVRLFAYSGRDLYRPGEQFIASVLARDADGRPVPPQPIQATLRRPDGHNQLVSTLKPNAKQAGYYQQRIDIPADAPTGVWTLELRHDPADKLPGTIYRFSVEEFLPERMKLDLASDKPRLTGQDGLSIDINGAYLYGAPAAGNRLLGTVEYARSRNPLAAKLPGYVFGSIDDDNIAKRLELEENSLDDNGQAQVDVDVAPARGRQSAINIRSTFSLLESGGRPVVRSLERVWWPAPALLGVRPKFTRDYVPEGALAEFDVVLADGDARMLAQRGTPMRLIREDRNWYWRYDDQRGWNSGFDEVSELVSSQNIDLVAGKPFTLKLPVRYGRYRLEIGTPNGPGSAAYRFYAGWSAQRDQSDGVRPDRVALKLDKPAYADNDTAHLTVSAPHHGEGIVMVEGDQLLWMKRVSIDSDKQQIDIPLDPSWKRHDLYVSVTVLRPGNQGDRVTPTRALGLIHLGIDRSNRRLPVKLAAPDKIRPDTTVPVKIAIAPASAKEAMVTVSAVDEGILNITEFKTPDPFQAFFGRLRYSGELRDLYGRLIEKLDGKKGKLRFGGDNSLKQPPKTPQKIKLVDLFNGPVHFNAQGEATVQVKVPDFNGRLRLMAVVAAPEQFGSAERSMVVAAPLIAEMNLPRFIASGDSAALALDLHNLSGNAQNLSVEVEAAAGLSLTGGKQSASLKDKEKTTLRLGVSAVGEPGLKTFTVKVAGNGINLKREFVLEVAAPTPAQQVSSLYLLAPGETVTLKNSDSAAWYPGRSSQLMLSALPPLNAQKVLQGLLQYPYGCAEQTTSSSYPWVFVDEEAAKRFGLPAHSREHRAEVLDKSFAKLGAYQAANGGFSLWGDGSAHDYWLSAYVTRFLQDARGEGFSVPQAMYDKALDYLQEQLAPGIASLPAKGSGWNGANGWSGYWEGRNRNFDVLAYGALVLAQERKVQLSTLRQLFELRSNANSGLALIELGIALQLMGDEAKSKIALAEGLAKPRAEGYWYDYGSPVRDNALAFALLQKHKLNPPGSVGLLAGLIERIKARPWFSTQDQMAVFLAARWLDATPGSDWSASLSGDKAPANLAGKAAQYVALPLADGAGYKLQNTGKDKLFAVMTSSGHPRAVGEGSRGLSVSRSYFMADGSKLPANPSLKTGQTIWVQVSTNANFFSPNLLVVDRVPAGLEIENTNLIQGEKGEAVKIDGVNPVEAMNDQRIGHVEFRDDRFVAAVRLGSWWNGPLRLFYRAKVVTPGRFVIPQSWVEDMYDPQLHAASKEPGIMQIDDVRPPAKGAVKSESDSIAAPAAK